MLSFSKRTIFAAIAVAGLIGPPQQAEAWVEAGMLTCEDSGGFSLILSSPRDLYCVFHKANGLTEAYGGRLRAVGRNLGATGAGVIAWSVVADRTDGPSGALTGIYARAESGATMEEDGEGRGLVGGPRRAVTLQPLRVGGNSGLNLAVGIAAMELHPLSETTARTAPTRVPAGGHRYDLVPSARQAPHSGCGSYTHLMQGQTIDGLARACRVTVEALLDANPQITNGGDIGTGALIHLPTHVGLSAASPCGNRAIVRENEALDDLAWRCGITQHALFLSNPSVRDMATVRPGQVMVVPARVAPPLAPPVRYVANEILLEPVARDLQFAEIGPARIMSRTRQTRGTPGQEQACADELAETLGIDRDRVRVTSRDVGRTGDALVYLYADGTRAACEVDRAYTVRGTRRMIPVRVTSSPPSSASGAGSNSGSLVERACMDAVRRQAGGHRAIAVLGNAVSQADSTVMVGVGPRRAPWRCVASNDGVVTDLSFAGDDSAGVRDAGAPMPGRTIPPPAR